jgi:translation initiation factor IF-2
MRDNRGGPPRRDQPRDQQGGPPRRRREEEGRPAKAADIKDFIDTGLQPKVEDDYRRQRRTRPAKAGPVKAPEGEFEGGKAARRKPQPTTDAGRKKIRPTQIFAPGETISDRRAKPRKKMQQHQGGRGERIQQPQQPKRVRLIGDFTVGDFAEKLGVPVNEVMKRLLMMGQMLTINHILEAERAEELALEMNVEIEIIPESDEADVASFVSEDDPEESLIPRAPVVTIMGHVDHGKTTLLDRIRKADVAAHEFGGITQHIGAYLVQTPKGDVVFLDTPGHEAFTEMRSRGANVTDLVILVVAANDGVMPQTVEAISHAKAAEVPILVAINKIDVDGSNPERIKQELMKYEMVPEEYGGDCIMLPVSAISGKGVEELLEYVALQTEIMELKANPDRPAEGTVVESHVDPTRGAVATVLVQRGTLRKGDIFVCGTEWGRVRAMRDDRNKELEEAGPSTPVEVLGLRGSPVAGESFLVMPEESEAREIAERRDERRRKRAQFLKPHISLDNLADHMRDDEVIILNLVLKADVQGSVEAITNALYKIKSDRVQIRVLHGAVGAVSSSDVRLAEASEAIVIGFNVSNEPTARYLAEESGVDIRQYQVIYHLLEDVEKAMLGMLAPEFEEKEEARARVQQTFRVSKVGTAAGCFVEEGTVAISHQARLIRNGAIVWRGKIRSLRRVKDEVKQVQSGVECGIGLENFNDIKEGDIIETYSLIERQVSLVSSDSHRKPETSRA